MGKKKITSEPKADKKFKSESAELKARIKELENSEQELQNQLKKNERLLNQLRVQLLSKREREVVYLIANGYSNKEIGAKLEISVLTADTHRKKIMKKLRMKNTALLVVFAVENKLN